VLLIYKDSYRDVHFHDDLPLLVHNENDTTLLLQHDHHLLIIIIFVYFYSYKFELVNTHYRHSSLTIITNHNYVRCQYNVQWSHLFSVDL